MELFLNSVPLLKSLSREEKLMLVDALEEQVFPAGTRVITQARALHRTHHSAASCTHVQGWEGLLAPTGCPYRRRMRWLSPRRVSRPLLYDRM